MYTDNIKPTKQRKVVRYREENKAIDSCSTLSATNVVLSNNYPPIIVINPYNYTLCA